MSMATVESKTVIDAKWNIEFMWINWSNCCGSWQIFVNAVIVYRYNVWVFIVINRLWAEYLIRYFEKNNIPLAQYLTIVTDI